MKTLSIEWLWFLMLEMELGAGPSFLFVHNSEYSDPPYYHILF